MASGSTDAEDACRRGRFITLEGGEGVGKSTQIETLRDWLAARGHDAVVTREPGGTLLAERVRELVTDSDESMPPLAELLLMFAARFSHVEAVIAPALDAGRWVICDRFVDASYAYQGAGRGLPPDRIATLEAWLPETARPDITILLDAPVELGLERARRRGPSDRFEAEQADFFRRIRDAYLARAREFPERFIVVDAAGSPAAVGADMTARLAKRLDQPTFRPGVA